MNDMEVGCSRMHLLMLSAHVTPALWQLYHCKRYIGKTRGLKSAIPSLCINSFHGLPPTYRQGSAEKCFDLLFSRVVPTPKPAPCSPPSQPSPPRLAAGASTSSRAFLVGWSHLLGTTSLLLVGSQCAGTGIIGPWDTITFSRNIHNHVNRRR